jgi:hypothetical protein
MHVYVNFVQYVYLFLHLWPKQFRADMGERGQIKVVLFLLCVLTVLVVYLVTIFTMLTVLLSAYRMENLFLKLMQPTKKCPMFFPPCIVHTVKSSNFVILLSENIFFRRTFLRLPNDFFQYWNLYSNGLGIGQSHYGLGHCLGLENSFFRRVTKLGDRLFISSPSPVSKGTMTTVDRGC